MSGARSYHAGLRSEEQVEAEYVRRGCKLVARRWRGRSGEIDLIMQGPDTLIFVEAKRARDFQTAAARITPRQMARIANAAAEFLTKWPSGQETPTRFDAALVDGTGHIQIIDNAFGV